jgi:hypothetical protein
MQPQIATNLDAANLDQDPSLEDVYEFETFADEYPQALPNGVATLKWLFQTRHRNGLHEAGAFITVGRSPRVVKPRFARWYLNRRA